LFPMFKPSSVYVAASAGTFTAAHFFSRRGYCHLDDLGITYGALSQR
jgi:hypothetical protein